MLAGLTPLKTSCSCSRSQVCERECQVPRSPHRREFNIQRARGIRRRKGCKGSYSSDKIDQYDLGDAAQLHTPPVHRPSGPEDGICAASVVQPGARRRRTAARRSGNSSENEQAPKASVQGHGWRPKVNVNGGLKLPRQCSPYSSPNEPGSLQVCSATMHSSALPPTSKSRRAL